MFDTPSIRQLSSPLTSTQLQPLDERCRVVQFDQSLTTSELRRVAALLDEYPSVALRVYGHRTYADLEFLELFGHVRNVQIDIYELQDSRGLRFLRPDLAFFGFGATRKRHSLASLERLTHVVDLWLEGHTKDFEVVGSLRTLRRLSLRSIRLPDLSPLRPLHQLQSLELKLGGTKDIRELPNIGRLLRFEAWLVRGLTDLDAIASVGSLRTLFLQSLSRVTSLPSFAPLRDLTRVHLEGMKGITDLAPVAAAPALRELLLVDMRHLQIQALRPFVAHRTLRSASIGLGSTRKNAEAEALLGLPNAPHEVQLAID
jgi:internalin A